ncbi:glycosyltransferase family 2 protein [Fusibacter bizertensis]|uniref:Glycosyltransferase family 2 protein n=1 Tax=Fusibacter bizertensis TaxID=1488331 RepID=A0ABT6ND08_9FIRM|nr:glycosyltransferase family 2 protein [Fusibacter bizertensis]MDH8678317.1 glycosyltransferase family 2 protein [Fusibacter bizertensis]
MQLSIVVPCYNEKDNIPLILNRFSEVIKDRSIDVILVDNGSTDGSNEVFEDLVPNYNFAKLVSVPINRGYGFGIVSGLKSASGDYIGWTHADMQTDPRDVALVYDMICAQDTDKPKNIYYKGLRKKRPLIDVVFTVGMSLYESVNFKMKLWDINAQPNIFPKVFFDRLAFFPDDFSLDLYMYVMAREYDLKVERFEVLFTDRIHGESKWNDQTLKAKWKFIKRTLSFSRLLKSELKTQNLE